MLGMVYETSIDNIQPEVQKQKSKYEAHVCFIEVHMLKRVEASE